jgi:hypothetical protein
MIAPKISLASCGAAWDFSKIRVFPADRVPRSDARDSLPEIIQRKLAIGRIDDPLELEAARIADQVMRMVEPSAPPASGVPQVSHKSAVCDDGEAKMLQPKPVGPYRAATGETPPIAHDVLRSPGEPLDAGTRAEMEARFQYNFAHMRVHANAQAAASAQALNACAYTFGQRIVFGPNRYAPSTVEGRWLLAHELAHTIQQRNGGDVRGSAEPDEILESSANAAACSVASGDTVSFRLPASERRVQRAPVSDLRWKNDVKAARYRGQLMAARIRQHGKLSSEARAKVNEELAYFEGAAKEAYIREVKPALAPFVEIQMPAMAMSVEPAKPQPMSKQLEYEAMAAYYESTRQSQLEAAATAHAAFGKVSPR